MVERLISAKTSEIMKMNASELKASIKASEGRVILSENMVMYKPDCDAITNAEIDRAFGADLILLNMFDLNKPFIAGLNDEDAWLPTFEPDPESVRKLKKLVGRPVGINLEPVNVDADMMEERMDIVSGRQVSKENVMKVKEFGFDFICLTGNPRTGVDNNSIISALQVTREHFDGLIIAGKMHSAGVNEPIIDKNVLKDMVKYGADVILAPSVGTVPGFTETELMEIVKYAHDAEALVMSTIGTSQEGSTPTVIEQIAIRNKTCGVDIQHIGDVSKKENIYTTSMAIRGERHTFNRMSHSVNR